MEWELVQLIVDQQWRLRRAAAVENALMGMMDPEGPEEIEIDTGVVRQLGSPADLHPAHPAGAERRPKAAQGHAGSSPVPGEPANALDDGHLRAPQKAGLGVGVPRMPSASEAYHLTFDF